MIDLDSPSAYGEVDTQGMLAHLKAFPEQCRLAWEQVSGFDLPAGYGQVDRVMVLGMGGSAIGGDVVRGLVAGECRVPIFVHRDYDLPPFVNKRSLVIASSYSGNTEETLSAFGQSLKAGARNLAVTTGGKLAEMAEEKGVPVYRIGYRAPPRAAFPHSLVPLLGVLQKVGLIADRSGDFGKMRETLAGVAADCAETVPVSSNPAKQLAVKLAGCVAVVYGAGMLGPVAQRWKTQLNENSKSWAFHESFPELNHNAVVGYLFPAQAREVLCVVLLHSALLHPRIRLRYRATRKILADAGASHEQVEARGDGALAQAVGLVLLGDYVSFYLSILNKVDPTPVRVIDYLKGFLERSPAGD